MSIDLGPIQFDEAKVLRQLRRDLADDWFPDPLRFEDLFDRGHVEQIIADNFQRNDGAFRAGRRTILNIPKGNFTLRYGLETGLADRALYHALTSYLVPFYDPLMPWNVFSHRAASGSAADRYLFRRPVPAWQDFTGMVRNTLVEGSVLLSTDLTNYFENIDLNILRQTLEGLIPELAASPVEKGHIRAHIAALFECLTEWCFSERCGLPQNRDASSFLANVYMLPVDRAMIESGYQYFRYMDDIKIACGDRFTARQALKQLSLHLRSRGLSVNSGKTTMPNSHEVTQIAECLDAGQGELQQIDAIWQTRSLRSISRSFPLLSELTQRKLRAGEVGSRTFRYCIRRLETLASSPEFAVPPPYFAAITPLVIEALTAHPAATDELARYIRAVPTSADDLNQVAALLQDDRRNFYTWQNYRLWQLLVQKEHRTEELLAYAATVVQEQPDNATRCGATLYLGAFGNDQQRALIAQRFRSLDSFIGQRAALIAVQELHFRPHIEEHVQPHLRDDLRNVYRGLGRAGRYMAPPEPRSITRIIDVDRDYD